MNLLSNFLDRIDFDNYEDFISNYKIKSPEKFNFATDVVDVYAEKEPEKRALIWINDEGEEKFFSFSDMSSLSKKAANVFKDQGIGRGDKVMLVMKSRWEFWIALLGLHRLGAIGIPATHMLTTPDFVYRIEKASIKAVVTIGQENLPEHIDLAQKQTGDILKIKFGVLYHENDWLDFNQLVDQASDQFETDADIQKKDLMLIYFSSGTSGMPKMVSLDYEYPLGHILTAKYWQNVIDGGLHYTVADSGWAKFVWGKIYGQWIAGSAVFAYDYDKFEAANVMSLATKYGVTTFCAPPTIYRFMIKEGLKNYDFSTLKYCVVAGEPLNPELYDIFLKYTGIKLMEGYGQTELLPVIANFPWMEPKPGSMGKPSPTFDISLVNADGEFCETGEEGEIVIKTTLEEKPVGMFSGYYLDDEMNHSQWHDGYYHTGDTAWKDEDDYLWFIGRADDVIKSSGYRIGPFEVESALIQHPAVMECAITSVPDPIRGQVVKATVVLSKNYTASEELVKELQNHVKAVTAPYKYPRIIEFVKELPKTISGKIRRVEIRDKDAKK
ncbi:MAG: AMP-binding protein [Bacteroidota bacterium]|nr:AMP-binding protein [Bacteroidota bacterium]